jgi:hypothetical protein
MSMLQSRQPARQFDARPDQALTIATNGATFVEIPYKDKSPGAVSISARGRIGLPKELVSTYQALRRLGARLYWDRNARAIATILVDKEPTVYPVLVVPKSGGASVSAERFFRACDLQLGRLAGRHRYEVKPAREVGIRNVPENHQAYIGSRYRAGGQQSSAAQVREDQPLV